MLQSPRRILLYTASLAGGGAEKVFVHLAEAFANLGHTVTLAVDRFEGDYCDLIDRRTMHLVDLNAPSTRAAVKPLAALIQRMQPEVVLSALVYNNLAAIRSVQSLPTPQRPKLYVTNHTATRQHIRGSFPPFKAWITLKLVQRLYPHATGVTGVSTGVAEDLADFIPLPFPPLVLHNPVLPVDVEQRYGEGIPENLADLPRPLFLSVGRLTRQKGFHDLLEAFALYRQAHGKGSLLILGQGEEKEALLKQAEDLGIGAHLHLPGFQKNIFAFYPRADVLVMSSYWEGFGNVLVEAMGAETPVVSTDCPSGPREILMGGKYGHLVPIGDAAAIAAAMAQALDMPETMKRAAKERADDFRIPTIANAYLKAMFGTNP